MPLRSASTATGAGNLAVTPHDLATAAALEIMDGGGNAVDGAVAANAVLGVVLPTACGIGGDLFALVHRPGMPTPWALNASGRAGAGASAEVLRKETARMPLHSPWSVTVPGCIDGWEALLGRLGSVSLAAALEPATRAAAGFPVSPELARGLALLQPHLADQESAFELYPGGESPTPGATLSRPALAEVLDGIAAGGRAAFYEGGVAAAITAATDGLLTPADLEPPQADWIDPLPLEVFGLRAFTIPPNSQGYLTLAAAWIAERLGGDSSPAEAAAQHALIESYRAVAWERDEQVADPEHAPLPAADLLAPDRLASRVGRISADTVAPWPAPEPDPGGTAYLCTVDREGLGVSLIQSNFHGIGSRISAGGTGVWLHNRGAGFNLIRGHPNELAPGKRPLHTLSPTLWLEGRDLRLLLGTRGGHQQPQLLLQVASHLLRSGLEPGPAQEAPRWTMDDFGPGSISRVNVEATMPAAVVDGLRDRGHEVSVHSEREPGWGPVSLIAVDATGVRHGAADPRIETATAAAS